LEKAVAAVLTDAGQKARAPVGRWPTLRRQTQRVVNDILSEADQKEPTTINKLLLNAY
jgi:hypothetical protein